MRGVILPPYNVTYVCNVGANPTASPFRILLPDFPAEDCLCHFITHYVCYHLCVTNTNYHRSLFEAEQDLARCLVKRQKLDHKIARLQAVISDLHNLCAELDQKSFEKRVDRVIKALAAGRDVSVKLAVREGSQVEHFWLSDVTYSTATESFSGKIDNDPDTVRSVVFGQEVSVR